MLERLLIFGLILLYPFGTIEFLEIGLLGLKPYALIIPFYLFLKVIESIKLRQMPRIQITSITISGSLFLLWLLLSNFWSTNKVYSFSASIKYIYFFITFLLISFSVSISSKKAMGSMAVALAISSLIVSGFVYFRLYDYGLDNVTKILGNASDTINFSRYTTALNQDLFGGFGGHHNMTALWLLFSWIFLLASSFQRHSFLFLWIANLIFTIPAFYFQVSRSALLGLVVWVSLLLLTLIITAYYKRQTKWLVLAISVLILSNLIIVVWNPLNSGRATLERLRAAIEAPKKEAAIEVRKNLIKRTWNLFQHNPFWGIGIWNTYQYFSDLAEKVPGSEFPHNLYLQILAELGFVGISLFLAFMGIPIVIGLKVLLKPKITDQRFSLSIVLLLHWVVVYLVLSIFGFRFVELEIWMVLATLNGLYNTLREEYEDSHQCHDS